ncbi:type II toxin-antitoxin system VapC family toxin [Myceligenerans pegani]|uniref:Ribonuclease VapC n=1 Tax=Myceligenerans pegani TaxID=2776917 RepID=A0ABR9MUK2_9MICO|nr:PIN domain-containing protein [Myceligenerans sp. TRM 65318]MBE1874795.1 type II toxin-antitoxin system VapC family toxin [Myceligenerans sp. TRM 65318]MBE3017066.1 type II toxin-antitoxin system VapC family toxin [Myceligenerans sp. TRM 65318]
MIVADANIVIAASRPEHVHHGEATRIVVEHGRDGIVLHSLTMAEVLVGPAKSGAQVEARQKLQEAGFGLSPEGDPSPEELALVRATAALKMPDACVLATAERLKADVATFDARLAREARARGVRVRGLPE